MDSASHNLSRAAFALLLACAACEPKDIAARPAPDFRLDTLDHKRFYLNAQRGRTVVLLFWDTSCRICKTEMAEFEELKRLLAPKGLVVAAVCADPENVDLARRICDGLGLTYPILLDTDAKVAGRYAVGAYPTTVLVGPRGRERFRLTGFAASDMRGLRARIERLLAESGGQP